MGIYKRLEKIATAYGLKIVEWNNADDTCDLIFSGFGAMIMYRLNTPKDVIRLTRNEILFFSTFKNPRIDRFFEALEQFTMVAGMELVMPAPTDVA